MNVVRVKPWHAAPDAATRFLEERYETSLFLLGNKEAHGTELGESPNSGNFRVVFRGNDPAPCAVFCLTRRGNLLLQGDATPNLVHAMCEDVRAEGRGIRGVIGPWPLAAATWDELSRAGDVADAQFRSEEILYRLENFGAENVAANSGPKAPPGCSVRLARDEDVSLWLPARLDFLRGEGLPQDQSEAEMRTTFTRLVRDRWLWLAIDASKRLAGMAGLNAKVKDIGQVGGVYTAPSCRGHGIGEAILRAMFADLGPIHGVTRLILFTGREAQSAAARRLYERVGFEQCGSFGLILTK